MTYRQKPTFIIADSKANIHTQSVDPVLALTAWVTELNKGHTLICYRLSPGEKEARKITIEQLVAALPREVADQMFSQIIPKRDKTVN